MPKLLDRISPSFVLKHKIYANIMLKFGVNIGNWKFCKFN